jgi:hypothetical protein
MKSKFASSLLGAISFISVLTVGLSVMRVQAGEAVFYVTEEGNPVSDLAITVDGEKKLVRSNGFISFDVEAGNHQVEFSQLGAWAGEATFSTSDNQTAEIQVELLGGEALTEVNVFADNATTTGILAGYLISRETDAGVVGAKVSVSKDIETTTNQQGYFEFEVPRGAYEVMIEHSEYGQKKIRNLRVLANVETAVNVDMSMSGDGVIEEVVAIGTYVADSVTAQERDSSAVLDSIGSEQFARFGDSSAASALKRVSGVSLIGGQFAVIRGLQGRYISSTLNGSLMPSTDPMRRDVPLDLFPSNVLGGINIQKSYTPDLPGDTTGGAILMETKGLPEELINKISLTLGMNNRTTFSEVNGYEGGGLDSIGIDDGTRELPGKVNSKTNGGEDVINYCSFDPSVCTLPGEGAEIAKSFDNNFAVNQIKARPETGFSFAHGDVYEVDGQDRGYYAALQYKNKWEARHDAKVDDLNGNGEYERTKVKTDLTGYLVFSLEDENKILTSKTILLRKTDNSTRTSSINDDDEGQIIDKVTLEWVERQYVSQQFLGEHFFGGGEHEIDWRIGLGQTTRYEPDRRTYSYINDNLSASTVERRFSDLTENAIDFGLDYTFDYNVSDDVSIKLKTGYLSSIKSREVEMARFGLNVTDNALDLSQGVEDILSPENLDSFYLRYQTTTANTDSYDASDVMKAFYGSAELVFEDVSMLMGARSESASQKLEYTKQPAANNTLNSDDLLPVVSVNWMATEELQLRASMSQTLSRPGITERSQSVQYDPETDDQIFGNPTLKISKITNVDVRAEYYFSDYESITLALFHKDIIDPIERTIPNASGSASDGSTFRNEDSALLQGLEVDFRKDVIDEYNWLGFISGNYTYINAEVVLSEETASLEKVNKRKLQGQSENLANIQFGVDHLGTGQNLTLLVNYFDDRIYKASRSLAPEVEEGRMSIDMVYQYEIDEDTSLKAKAVNITDEKIVFSRDSKEIESYYNGIGFNMTLSKNF